MSSFFKLPPEFRNGYIDRKRRATLATMQCIICKHFEKPPKGKTAGRHETHHFIGCGLGRKASDLLTIPLCFFHHQANKDSSDQDLKEQSIHGLTAKFEARFATQYELLKMTNEELGCHKQYEEYYKIIELNKK